MNNYVQRGDALVVTAPYAVSAGGGVQVGSALFGVAVDAASSGATNLVIRTEGVFDIAKATTQAYAAGARVFWDNSGKTLTSLTTGNIEAGVVIAAAGTTDTTARIKIGHTPVVGA